MRRFTINATIDVDDDEDIQLEVFRTLNSLQDRILEAARRQTYLTIFDTKGNDVGRFRIVEMTKASRPGSVRSAPRR